MDLGYGEKGSKNIFQSFMGEDKPLMKAIYNKKRLETKPFKFYTM